MNLNRRSFAWYDTANANWRVDNGHYCIQVGASSRDIRLSQVIDVKLGTDKPTTISEDTYLNQVIGREDLKSALKQSGLDVVFG